MELARSRRRVRACERVRSEPLCDALVPRTCTPVAGRVRVCAVFTLSRGTGGVRATGVRGGRRSGAYWCRDRTTRGDGRWLHHWCCRGCGWNACRRGCCARCRLLGLLLGFPLGLGHACGLLRRLLVHAAVTGARAASRGGGGRAVLAHRGHPLATSGKREQRDRDQDCERAMQHRFHRREGGCTSLRVVGGGDASPVPHRRLRRQPERRITARDTALTNRSAD